MTDLAARARAVLGDLEGEAFLARLDLVRPDLHEALAEVYGDAGPVDGLVDLLVDDALGAAAGRPLPLRRLDRRREVDPTWFLSERMVGYVCYADRYADDLRGVAGRLDHLADLGVTYLHLMPLLRPREGENDGGYAVADYDEVDPRLGTNADLTALAEAVHDRGMALCVDLVLNHTAREHAWAQAALAGDPTYRAYYRFFGDRSEPDAYERTLPEVFPDMAPGSFSPVVVDGRETGEWVWTTFHEFQWDLDWTNPEVFRAMLGVLLRLANRGPDVVRLDAVPFLWKRMGTDCQNQPEAHRLVQALRALTRLAMPGVLLKAEAIVGPDHLLGYLGAHDEERRECDLAYDNQLMVMMWSALAARDTRLAEQALGRRRAVPAATGWVTYVRCHDDIGWAVDDGDAWAVGSDPAAHRRFLADFYAGVHEGSFARGAYFQYNPVTGDARTSGSAADLVGLRAALEAGDAAEVDVSLRRLELLYSVAFSYGGIPLVYMGDELAMLGDTAYAEVPAHADDNRWLHRPRMDWALAASRTDATTVAGRAYAALVSLAATRRATSALRSDAETTVLRTENPHLFAYRRKHPRSQPFLAVANFSDHAQEVPTDLFGRAGLTSYVVLRGEAQRLPPWGHLWVLGVR